MSADTTRSQEWVYLPMEEGSEFWRCTLFASSMPSCLLYAVGAEIKDWSLRVLRYKREVWRETGVACLGGGVYGGMGLVGEGPGWRDDGFDLTW